MRCLVNIINVQDCPQDCKTSTCKEHRLAALRKAVEGLQSVTRGEAGAAQAGAGDLRRGRLRWLDCGLPAELPCGALNEVVAAHADRPAAFGFLFALTAMGLGLRPDLSRDLGPLSLELQAGPAVLVAARRALSDFGAPYGHGLAQLGLDVGRLLIVETRTDKDALWALEETLRSGVRPAVVAGALSGGLDLTSCRRLNLAAAPQRTPLVVLSGTDAAGTSAAAARWRIAAAPAARDRFGAFAVPRWHVALERCRLGNRHGRPMNNLGAWLIEWNHVSHRFRVAAGLADRPPVRGDSLRHAG